MKTKPFSLAVAVAMLSAAAAKADHHKEWLKYLSGSWKVQESGDELDFKLVADGNAAIGTGRSSDQGETAWIMGWNPTKKCFIHEWFGAVIHGRVSYNKIDAKTLRGAGAFHLPENVVKGTVTITKKSDNEYIVSWTDMTAGDEKMDDFRITVKKR